MADSEWQGVGSIKLGPEKTSGMHRCIPDSSFRICSYLFFFAFFFAAILFSSKLFEIHASMAGGARIQSHV
jgi:hypothetical protein